MPRFVLLWHEVPSSFGKPSHWDLMLERDVDSPAEPKNEHRLATWNLFELPTAWASALAQPVSEDVSQEVAFPLTVKQLPDHRAHYLDYEGPVSKGRGTKGRGTKGRGSVERGSVERGKVKRLAAGTLEWVAATNVRYEAVLAAPSPLAGTLVVYQDQSATPADWLLDWSSQ